MPAARCACAKSPVCQRVRLGGGGSLRTRRPLVVAGGRRAPFLRRCPVVPVDGSGMVTRRLPCGVANIELLDGLSSDSLSRCTLSVGQGRGYVRIHASMDLS